MSALFAPAKAASNLLIVDQAAINVGLDFRR
jgi:hypothetical protein